MTYRCFDCGADFYYRERPQAGAADDFLVDGHIIDDEEALRAAEEEVRKQVEEDGNRTCW